MPEIQVFSCPPVCDAGGEERDGGHKFDIPFEEESENGSWTSGAKCKCGMRNIDFDMMNMP